MKNKNQLLDSLIILLIFNQQFTLIKTTTEQSIDDQILYYVTTTDIDIEYERPIERLSINDQRDRLIDFDDLEHSKDDENLMDDMPTRRPDADSVDDVIDISIMDNRNKTIDLNEIEISNMRSEDNEHSEIEETTTFASMFDDVNFTLPSLSRMIEMSEQGELDILNKTEPRRLQIDMNTNEEIIGINDINKLIENDLNTDYDDEPAVADVLNAPSGDYCGRNRRKDDEFELSERIIGGSDAYPGEVPWIVSIRLKHPNLGHVGHWCSSVLINLEWVATASHCLINPLFHLPEPKYWEVRLGKLNISKTESTQKTYQVAKIFNVKQYRGYDNDLALLKLQTKVETTEFIRPICLPPNENFDFSNADCYVAGFDKKGADVLQKVKVNVYDNKDCQRVYHPKFRIMIQKWHLCAGNKFGGKGTCHGDSGGPMACRIRNQWYLAGVTSFGFNCAKYGFPDVFTRITYFLSWIKEKIRDQ